MSARLELPFSVLVDPDRDRAVYHRYGLDKVLITLQHSGAFLIDKQGIVRYIQQVQEIVPDLETALRRIGQYVLPWEDAQVRKVVASLYPSEKAVSQNGHHVMNFPPKCDMVLV